MNSTGIHGFLQPPMLDLRDFTWISRILQILSKNPQNLPRPQLHVKREVGDVRSGPGEPDRWRGRGAGVARAWRGRLPLRVPPRGKGTLRYKQFNSTQLNSTQTGTRRRNGAFPEGNTAFRGPRSLFELS